MKPFSARELLARVETQLLRAEMRAIERAHRQRMAELFQRAPAAIAILVVRRTCSSWRTPYLAVIGGRDIIGKPIREAFPELRTRPLQTDGRSVRSGVAYKGTRGVLLVAPDRAGGGVFQSRLPADPRSRQSGREPCGDCVE